ncbi:MAG: squalene synthase HpnC [Bacteroidota bacterium]|nr:squalene synthase HpnC [Bacteroidota bacterium]
MTSDLETLAKQHYENFPVASVFVPPRQRKALRLVYAFARVADDFADEGNFSVRERIERLDLWEKALHNALEGNLSNAALQNTLQQGSFFHSLASAILEFNVPVNLFDDLLTAFRMDAREPRFTSFEDLLFYCKHSANPVGRIVLYLFGSATEQHCSWSDDICTALQLTNFWQDYSVDIEKKRVYIPDEDLERFGCSRGGLLNGIIGEHFPSLMKFEVERTKELFRKGSPLLRSVDTKFRFQLRLTWYGGMRVLEKIEQNHFDTVRRRVTLNMFDGALVFFRSR